MRKFTLSLLILLAGCGGGGGGSSSTTQPDPIVTPSFSMQTSTSINELSENQTFSIPFTYQNAVGNVQLSVNSVSTNLAELDFSISADNAAQSIEIEISELITEGTMSFTVSGVDENNKTDTVSLSFTVDNTSIATTLDQLSIIQEKLPSLLELTDEIAVLEKLTELAKLANIIDPNSENDALIFNEELKTIIENAFLDVDFTAQYQGNTTDEQALRDIISKALSDMTLYSQDISRLLHSRQQSLGDNLVKPFPDAAIYSVDTELRVVSQFWQNNNMGELVDGQWQFLPDYAYLEAIILPQLQLCNAE